MRAGGGLIAAVCRLAVVREQQTGDIAADGMAGRQPMTQLPALDVTPRPLPCLDGINHTRVRTPQWWSAVVALRKKKR